MDSVKYLTYYQIAKFKIVRYPKALSCKFCFSYDLKLEATEKLNGFHVLCCNCKYSDIYSSMEIDENAASIFVLKKDNTDHNKQFKIIDQ